MRKFTFETKMSESVFRKKYMLENEKEFEESVERLVKVFCMYYPDKEEEIRDALYNKHIAAAGGMWRSACNPKKTSSINCTTLFQPEDNLESIADSWYWWAKFAAYGQGEGVDLSKLRPRGSKVHNSAETSTGAVSFMKSYNSILDTIAQQGRRGASLISLHVGHPDIEEFIFYKDVEGAHDTANISVHITDKFMEAVEADSDWELSFETSYEKITKIVKAKWLFDTICEHAWKSGDPGVQFIDAARRYSNSDYLGYPVVSTNAPVPGNTIVPTKNGLIPIKKLYEDGSAEVIYNDISERDKSYLSNEYCKTKKRRHTNNAYSINATFKKYENQKKFKIFLKNGKVLESNGEHKWLTNHGMIETKNILPSDYIFYNEIGANTVFGYQKDEVSNDFKEGAVIGWLVGDGWLGNDYSAKKGSLAEHKNVGMIWKDGEEEIIKLFLEKFKEITGSELNYFRDRGTSYYYRASSKKFYNYLKDNFGFTENKYNVPDKAFTNFNFASGFLSALFDADGCFHTNINKRSTIVSHQIILTSSNKNIVTKVQDLLLNWYGISSNIVNRGTNKGVKYTLSNGEEKISNFKESYNLCICRKEDLFKFERYINFFHEKKRNKLSQALSSIENNSNNKYHAIKVSSVEETDEYEDMYCAVVPEKHAFVCNGMISSNCSEQFLDPHNVCILSSINLAKFNEYGFEGFKKLSSLIVYFLDAFRRYELDGKRSPSQIQLEKLRDLPRIGAGVTGLADYFIDNEIVYASKDSISECKKLFSNLAGEAYKASYEIAKRDGHSFPLYDKEKYKQSPFVQRLLNEGLIEDYHLDYQAHVCKTTVAPNGCIVSSSEIKTENGIISIKDLFYKQGVDINENFEPGTVIDLKTPINVETIEGLRKVNKLYVNGQAETIKVVTEGNREIEGTFNHKILVKLDNNKAIWKPLEDLNKDDIILIKK